MTPSTTARWRDVLVWSLTVAAVLARPAGSHAQDVQTGPPLTLAQPEGRTGPPLVLTLADALERATRADAQYQSSVADADVARGDRVQARASLLPALSGTTQYIGNQSNGVNPNGRFISMDGVNMYRAWAVVHGELSANVLTGAPLTRARAAEAAAQARLEVAARGLAVTVTRGYYALVVAQRKYAGAQDAARQASRFLDITRQQQEAGQVARSDVVKADLQYQQQQQNYREAYLAMDNARLALAVLVFPAFDENFTVVDDLASAPALPAFADVRALAEHGNPDLRAAGETMRAASQDVRMARFAFAPSIAFEGIYGLEANEFALHGPIAAQPELGVLPNLGYAVTVAVSVPVWDWGGLRSRLQQSQARARQAQIALSQAQRKAVSDLYSKYNEVVTAKAAVDSFQNVAALASESLRLTTLRYQAGESTALEVVDAQNTLVQTRDAFDNAGARYRVALADLQSLTGSF